jgi:hypothetical protein
MQRAGYTTVNSGQVLAEILGIPPIPITPRAEFQKLAEEFIAAPDGPATLGGALAKAVEALSCERVLIDGIRHPPTLEAFRANLSIPVALLYVYTPPDVAYEMYRCRDGHNEESITFQQFIQLYTAPVESRIRYLIGEADIITFNWLGVEGYEKLLDSLTEELYAN